MSDLEIGDGGETVFKNGWPVGLPADERKTREVALAELRESGDAKDLRAGSWEESMVADCRSRLAVVPHSARAVLFYSQHPNGEEDRSSLHGGCPVLSGEKWAVSLYRIVAEIVPPRVNLLGFISLPCQSDSLTINLRTKRNIRLICGYGMGQGESVLWHSVHNIMF